MIKLFALLLAAVSVLLSGTAFAKPAKPVSALPTTSLDGMSAAVSGQFSQTFDLTTWGSYNGQGVITVVGSSSASGGTFSDLSITVNNEKHGFTSQMGTLAATFDDASSAINLAPSQTYRVTVFGISTVPGAVYALNATGGFSSGSVYPAVPVPEPETYAMMMAGLGLLGVLGRRKKQQDSA